MNLNNGKTWVLSLLGALSCVCCKENYPLLNGFERNSCAAFLSPCRCTNTSCCGLLNNVLNINCFHLPIGVNSVNQLNINDLIPQTPNPCLNVACTAGLTCHTVSVISRHGLVETFNTECCSSEKFSQVNCGANINCQQYNSHGSYTACCNGGCIGN